MCEPPHRLSVTWKVNWTGLVEALGQSLGTYDIEPAGNATRLTLTEAHNRPLGDDNLSGGRESSSAILTNFWKKTSLNERLARLTDAFGTNVFASPLI